MPKGKINQQYLGFEAECSKRNLPLPRREVRFHLQRKWKFDFCWVKEAIALEVDGGAWSGGRHTRGAGFIGDIEKLNEAQLAGWMVLRCTPKDIKTGDVFTLLARAFARR